MEEGLFREFRPSFRACLAGYGFERANEIMRGAIIGAPADPGAFD
jgi:hypothetical protein